jgi:hypothetical protein
MFVSTKLNQGETMIETAKQISAAAKTKARRFLVRARITLHLLTLSAVLLVVLGAHKGWIIAQFIPPAMAIGAPAEMAMAVANEEAAETSQPPHHRTIKSADADPLPGRKPVQ